MGVDVGTVTFDKEDLETSSGPFNFSASISSVSDKGKEESVNTSGANNKGTFFTNYRYWNQQTGYMSVNNFDNVYFQGIVDMGIDAVPYILEEIEKKPSQLVHALDLILPGVVEYDGFVTIKEACEKWLSILK